MKKLVIATVLLALFSVTHAEPIDFDNLNIASTTYGTIGGDGYPRLLVGYKNNIYFI